MHSGSGGDSMDILINNGVGGYKNTSGYVVRFFGEISTAEVFVSDVSTNGFYNIIIDCLEYYDDALELHYENERYEIRR